MRILKVLFRVVAIDVVGVRLHVGTSPVAMARKFVPVDSRICTSVDED